MSNVFAFNPSIMEETIDNQMKILKFLDSYKNDNENEEALLKGIPATKESYAIVELIRKHLCRGLYRRSFLGKYETRPVIRLKGRGPRKGTSGNRQTLPLWESKVWSLYIHNDVNWSDYNV